jgi:hypothetical protein
MASDFLETVARRYFACFAFLERGRPNPRAGF